MTQDTALDETTLARDCLQRLGDEDSVLYRAAQVLEMVGKNSVGLGEVLQDFAHQSLAQLRDLAGAACNIAAGMALPGDAQTLCGAHFVVKTTRMLLERTPVAMQRNMASTIGEKERLSRADVLKTAHDFSESPDIKRLLAAEDSGAVLCALLTGERVDALAAASSSAAVFSDSTLHH